MTNQEIIDNNHSISKPECDHDFKHIVDSFDHEFGTQYASYLECRICGYVDSYLELPQPCYEDGL